MSKKWKTKKHIVTWQVQKTVGTDTGSVGVMSSAYPAHAKGTGNTKTKMCIIHQEALWLRPKF